MIQVVPVGVHRLLAVSEVGEIVDFQGAADVVELDRKARNIEGAEKRESLE